jgi:carboxylesterase
MNLEIILLMQTNRISQVLLGGHGRDYQTFKASNWQGWRSSITEEYEKIALGYTNISMVGSSTGEL